MKHKIKIIAQLSLTLCIFTSISANAEWFFRGTPNTWATTQLETVSEFQDVACIRANEID